MGAQEPLKPGRTGGAIASMAMSVQALALVLTAAVLHALWNLAAKRVQVDGVAFVWLYVVGSVVLWGRWPSCGRWSAATGRSGRGCTPGC